MELKIARILWVFAAVCGAWLSSAQAEEAASRQPKPIPKTRPEMKQALENLKQRQARLPLPPASNQAQAPEGSRPSVNNGRARSLYLPDEWLSNRQGSSSADGTLDYTFKVRLFWIVSRANNCQYCLGHQEHKLTMAGMEEDQIAALDSDWAVYPAEEQAAMDFTRKITLAPHTLTAKELEALRAQYTDVQWIELVHTVASYNSTNRWTDSLGLPQDHVMRDKPVHLDTPTSEQFRNRPTIIFDLPYGSRPPLESRSEVEAALSSCRGRAPRAVLLSEDKAREVLPADWSAEPLPQWVRALAQLGERGAGQIKVLRVMQETGKLQPRLKAQLAWIAARQDRAWYAVGHAKQRLADLGLSDDAIYALDGDWANFTAPEKEAFGFARKLTVAPQTISDDDIARLRKNFSDHEVAEVVQVVCVANMFNRFTETLNLTLER